MLLNNNTRVIFPQEKYIKEVRKRGLTKQIDWMHTFALTNRIALRDTTGEVVTLGGIEKRNINSVFVDEYIRVMTVIMTVFERCYGDNWDMHMFQRNYVSDLFQEHDVHHTCFDFQPMIYYPEIEIISENGDSHTIKGLWITFAIELHRQSIVEDNMPRFYITNIRGARTHLAFDEWNVGYRHSHISTTSSRPRAISLMDSSSYCIGSGDISQILPQINSEVMGITEDSIGFLCAIVDTMVKWESISGNPYHYINKITSVSSAYETPYVLYDDDMAMYTTRFLRDLTLGKIKIPRVDFRYSGLEFKAIFTQEHHDAIRDIIGQKYNWAKDIVIMEDEEDGNFYGYKANDDSQLEDKLEKGRLLHGIQPFIYLSTREIPLVIEDKIVDENENNISNFKVREEFLKIIKDELSTRIYKQQIDKIIASATT